MSRTVVIAVIERADRISQQATASSALPPPASTRTATIPSIPTAPASSGRSRRLRDRMSNHSSSAASGAITMRGVQNAAAPNTTAAPASDARAMISTISTRCASRVRGNVRCRRRSTSTTFKGVHARNAKNAATPRHTPAALNCTINPSRTASNVRPQPPCSVGSDTALIAERARGVAEASVLGSPAVATASVDLARSEHTLRDISAHQNVLHTASAMMRMRLRRRGRSMPAMGASGEGRRRVVVPLIASGARRLCR